MLRQVLRLLLLDRRQHFLRVSLGLDLGKYLRDATLLVDQKRRPLNSDRRSAVHVFFLEYAEGFAELFLFVAQH